ncbi:serine protease [Rouxiella sp. WC2420]|uniref:Serine protease n=1 Tax=Rouxiella sp. WC2420 TaxID=3234145 RepID=A0AB39VMU1_9GAMM
MKNNWMMKAIPTAIVLALTSGQAIAHPPSLASPASKQTTAYAVEDKPLAPRDLVKELAADNAAQASVRHMEGTTITLTFSKISLSQGAVLEVSSPSRSEAHRYTSQELAAIFKRYGFFNAVAINGDTAIVRVVYPQGATPGKGDSAILAGYAVSLPPKIHSEMDFSHRRSVSCLKNSHPELYQLSDAIGMLVTKKFNGGTGWLLGTGNAVITNHHVVGGKPEEKVGLIPGQSMWFNYQTKECEPKSDPTATLTEIIKIKLDRLLATSATGMEHDWSLLRLDPLEYREAAIKPIFGGLALSARHPINERVSLIGHGLYKEDVFHTDPDGNLLPDPVQREKRAMLVDYKGKDCTINRSSDFGPDNYASNCESAGGNSGSPLFSMLDDKVVGMNARLGEDRGSEGIRGDYILSHVQNMVIEPETAVIGTGHVKKDYRDFAAFASPQTLSFKASKLSFSPLVEGRKFTHKSGYSLLKSVAQDNLGKEVPVIFRLAQQNACDVSNLEKTCSKSGATTLRVWIDPQENAASVPQDNSVVSWLPIAVKSNGKLIANQMLHYQYSHYQPQKSPFNQKHTVVKKTLRSTGENALVKLIETDNFRSGITAVRPGEGPLAETPIDNIFQDGDYAGMTPLVAEVVNQKTGKKFVLNLRAGLINSCTVVVSARGNWTPMNSSACKKARPGVNNFTSGSVYALRQDNTHLPSGRYTGLLPLMVRQWDTRATQPVELALDYLVK